MSETATTEAGIETNGGTWRFADGKGLRLDSGARLEPLEIGYKTYGRLNEARSNAILVCHALTGDQHAASTHPVTGKPGWWNRVIGPGLPLDTDRVGCVVRSKVALAVVKNHETIAPGIGNDGAPVT